MDYQFLVQPATAKAGTKVRVTARFRARLTVGAKFGPGGERTCFGKNSERADVTGNYDISLGRVGRAARKSVMYLYATPPARATDFPDNPKLEIEYTEKMNDNNQPYILSDCAYNSHWTTVYTLTIPSKKNLPTGRYLLGLTNPMKMETVMRNGVRVPLASVGGSTQGRLPALRVIE
ncbi:hypothetical protein BTM25_36720 [Actinomadura rubteroloni]|uniref:Uncharacterized protein n=2 Tax=Actinomadura rubteroloni TaxID=1926885 RepID=A0A2P4UJ33_9ACTN|nr:hypothetical protein BTM25_36720 [Actinomadura rubteroloni]